jgi:hypothetical protein
MLTAACPPAASTTEIVARPFPTGVTINVPLVPVQTV